MSDNILKLLKQELEKFLQPVLDVSGSPQSLRRLFATFGWDIDALTAGNIDQISKAVDSLGETINNVYSLLENPPDDLMKWVETLDKLEDLFQALTQIQRTFNVSSPPADFDQIGLDLLNALLLSYLEWNYPAIFRAAILLTLIDAEDEMQLAQPSDQRVRPPYYQREIHFDRIPRLFSDLPQLLSETYTGNRIDIAEKLFPRLALFLATLRIRSIYGLGVLSADDIGGEAAQILKTMLTMELPLDWTEETDASIGVTIAVAPLDQPDIIITLIPFGKAQVTQTFGTWTLNLLISAENGGVAIGPKTVVLDAATGAKFDGEISLTKVGEEGQPGLLIGGQTSTRLEIGQIGLQIEFSFAENASEYGALLTIDASKIVITAGDGDGFLDKVLPSSPFTIPFELGIGWSNKKGVYFTGGAGLEINIPVNKTLFDVVEIEAVYLALYAKSAEGTSPPRIDFVIAVSANVKLGPFSASVQRLGLKSKIAFPPEAKGNLGVADLALGFKPPNGAGLSLDTSIISGGGFLYIDEEKGQYAGGLQLDIKKKIAITAIGLINTKLPDGRKTFSLLVIISAEFPGIQLGYGFSLNGVGGLLGVNRTMMVDVLRAGIKTKVLDSIMFPKNIAQNANKIISDLSTVFPPAEGRFTFGLMVRICWGNSLITGDLGVILELPSPVRLAILGRLQLVLPTEEKAILSLRLDSIGILDFDRSEASIDASLYDSRVAKFDLAGDMALRIGWGDQPHFALSVGGFHPKFAPPPGFPNLARMSISLSSGDDFGIRLESYFALTANSLQFGARLDGYFRKNTDFGTFSAEVYLSLDALIKWPPFWFEVAISGGVSVKRNNKPLVTAELYVALSGPGPWLAVGHITVEFLGSHHCEFTWQSDDVENRELPPPPDLFSELQIALQEPSSWSAQLAGGNPGVTFRQIEASGVVFVHPFGTLTLRQRVAPLGVQLSRAGSVPLPQPLSYTVKSIRVGNWENTSAQEVRDAFAVGQFFELSDDEKLKHPAFDSLPSGYTDLSGGQAPAYDLSGWGIKWDYEVIVIDQQETVKRTKNNETGQALPAGFIDRATSRGAAGQAEWRRAGADRYANPNSNVKVSVNQPTYHVTGFDSLKAPNDAEPIKSYTEAEALRKQADKAGMLQIVGSHEVKK